MTLKNDGQSWSAPQLIKRLESVEAHVKDEWKQCPLLKRENEIGPIHRDSEVQWLMKLTSKFEFYPETFFLSVNILDRLLTKVKAKPMHLRCISLTCLYLASKMVEEEEMVPGTMEFIEMSDCKFATGNVLRMEKLILDHLDWCLWTTTSLEYMHIFHTLAAVEATDAGKFDEKTSQSNLKKLTHYSLASIVSNYSITSKYSSAVLALAVFSVDLEESSNQEWVYLTMKYQALAKLLIEDVMKCRVAVKRSMRPTQPLSPRKQALTNNPGFVLNVRNSNIDCIPKLPGQQGKRKANPEMSWDRAEDVNNKKAHSDEYYHVTDESDDDATLTASEDEDVMEISDHESIADTPAIAIHVAPTYADIVKQLAPLSNSKARANSPQQQPPFLVCGEKSASSSASSALVK